jgi:hypothetical protein
MVTVVYQVRPGFKDQLVATRTSEASKVDASDTRICPGHRARRSLEVSWATFDAGK